MHNFLSGGFQQPLGAKQTKAYCKTWALPLASSLYWHHGKELKNQRQELKLYQASKMKHYAKEVNFI